MTYNFFKFLFLNSLLYVTASYNMSLVAANNDVKAAATHDNVGLQSGGRHKWLQAGERKADIKNFPFLAFVVLDDDMIIAQSSCGGTIVSMWHLLTSAQCICDLNPICPKFRQDLFHIFVGSTYRWDLQKEAIHHTIEEIKLHPEFHKHNTYFMHDLSMIKIKGAFSFNDKVQMIKLPDPNVKENLIWMENSGSQCTVFGWNSTSALFISGTYKNKFLQLRYAKLNLITLNSCLDSWLKGYWTNTRLYVCAKGSGNDVCTGDKGGGLVCGTGDYRYILGVASVTYDCNSACDRKESINYRKGLNYFQIDREIICDNQGLPIIFNRVDTSLDFIKEIIEDITKSGKSTGDYIHNQLLPQYYGATLTSVLLLKIFKTIVL